MDDRLLPNLRGIRVRTTGPPSCACSGGNMDVPASQVSARLTLTGFFGHESLLWPLRQSKKKIIIHWLSFVLGNRRLQKSSGPLFAINGIGKE